MPSGGSFVVANLLPPRCRVARVAVPRRRIVNRVVAQPVLRWPFLGRLYSEFRG